MEIIKLEMITYTETIDHIDSKTSGVMEWEGKIKTKHGTFEFLTTKKWSHDNSGAVTTITSIRPRKINVDEWDTIHDEMIKFIEKHYDENKKEYERMVE